MRELASELVYYKAKVVLDQWDMKLGQSLTQFMESSIDKADFILVICTPAYAQKSNARRGGVGYEQQIISGRMAMGLKNKAFIPIIRRGTLLPGEQCAIPIHLTGLFSLEMRKQGFEGEDFDELLRAIFAIPRHKPPPLKQGPMFNPRVRKEDKKRTAPHLPHVDLDGYELLSGVVSNELYTKTFYLPSQRARQDVTRGDLVKLVFNLWDKNEKELNGERMWVQITGHRNAYLVGKLRNQPLTMDRNGWPLKWGDTILFLPEHIIDIEKKKSSKARR